MDYSAILREMDAELDRLSQARALLATFLEPAPQQQRPVRRTASPKQKAVEPQEDAQPAEQDIAAAEPPAVKLLPPRVKREYRRRAKSHVPEPRALAAPVSERPVVVQRPSIVPTPSLPAALVSSDALESAMRRHLLGGAA